MPNPDDLQVCPLCRRPYEQSSGIIESIPMRARQVSQNAYVAQQTGQMIGLPRAAGADEMAMREAIDTWIQQEYIKRGMPLGGNEAIAARRAWQAAVAWAQSRAPTEGADDLQPKGE